MEITSKLTKQITEAKYLTAENYFRYRPILRYFYLQYEKIKYWMYKEEVFEELKKHSVFESYTMEQLKQDLDTLVTWGNLMPVQDTSRATTVEEFKNKQFRYQLTEYSVEFERFTISLENLFIEGASLEASLFERIKDEVLKIALLADAEYKEVGAWWRNINSDFKRLNQNYQDYIRSFHSIGAEEKMKSREFIAYKDSLIGYLREFVKELQKNVHAIERALRSLEEEKIAKVLKMAFEYEKSIPRVDNVVQDDEILESIMGKWNNFCQWFIGSDNLESEASRVLDMTNEIIRRITRYAAQIAESRTSAANRKEEYKKICTMFLKCDDIYDAHRLSSLVFGIFRPRHFKSDFIRGTESVNRGVFDEEPVKVEIKPKVRNYREKVARSSIEDKSERKKKLLEEYLERIQEEKNVIDSFIIDGVLEIEGLPLIDKHVRVTILRWVGKALGNQQRKAKTDDGRVFTLVFPEDNKICTMQCNDGEFEMPCFRLVFEVEVMKFA